jgi:hypothetical protein
MEHHPRDESQSSLSRRRSLAFVLCCVILGLVLRFALAARSGLSRDEAQFLWVVRAPSCAAMLDYLREHESHPPFFYLLIRGWIKLAGDSAAAALALPLLIGVALIPTAFCVAASTFSRRTAMIATMMVTLSPLLVRYSAMVRPYSLLPFLCVLSSHSLFRGLRGRATWPWMLHVITTALMLLTHNWGWMVLGAEWLVAAVWVVWNYAQLDVGLIRRWACAQLAVVVIYAPWFRDLLHQVQHAGYGRSPLYASLVSASVMESALGLPVGASIAVCVALVVATAWNKQSRARMRTRSVEDRRLALLTFGGIPFFAFVLAVGLSFKTYLLHAHCLATIVPCALLIIAHLLDSYTTLPRLIATLTGGVYLTCSLSLLAEPKSNAREVAAMVAAQARPTDLILIAPAWYASSFNYYYAFDNPQIDYPHEERRGMIDFDDLRERLLDPDAMARVKAKLALAHRQGRRVWLVSEAETLSDPYHLRSMLPAVALESDRVPEVLAVPTYGHVAYVRTAQLRRQLDNLYGSPHTIIDPLVGKGTIETLEVLLYDGRADRACAAAREGTVKSLPGEFAAQRFDPDVL